LYILPRFASFLAFKQAEATTILQMPAAEKVEHALSNELHSPGQGDEAAMMKVAREECEGISEGLFFVTASAAMRKFRMQADLLAKVNVPVLILGESGSGKETAARLIHKLSIRSERPFAKVNCAALTGGILDTELFGCERGTSAGAMRTRQGKFELCHGGTIFLDEITEMPGALQAKLLQVVQENQIFRLGGESNITVDVRILAAGNVNIEQAMAEKRLREDLYYRLSAFTLYVPPLRDREEDIPLLLHHFIQRLAQQYSLQPLPVSPTLLNACRNYAWPGNLRELENVVKRYLVMGDGFLGLSELGKSVSGSAEIPWPAGAGDDTHLARNGSNGDAANLKNILRSVKGDAERSAIVSALEKTHWNRKAAARELGITYRSLLYKINDYELAPPGSLHRHG
jgi:two-component system, NtrC family, response regulator AtoC